MAQRAQPADGFRTRGQPAAVAAARAMLRGGMPHALLLTGPTGAGKSTLANDIAAALLCRDPDPVRHPCRECRSCRALEHDNHPDLHRLGTTGAGAVIPIGGPGREERGVRDLALVHLGEPGDVRQVDLLDDLEAAAGRVQPTFAATQLGRLDTAGERLDGNVSPELVVDALVLGWVA